MKDETVHKRTWAAAFALLASLALFYLAGCAGGQSPINASAFQHPAPIRVGFVGSAACATCHSTQYTEWSTAGHRWILEPVVGGVAPIYPFAPAVTNPPPGYTWNDISYVIGGFNRYALFLDGQGYVITGDQARYELATNSWVPYKSTIPYPPGEAYTCGDCHSVGWVPDDNLSQDGLPGIKGTWVESGVGCESCHGGGNRHTGACAGCHTNTPGSISRDGSAQMCGRCHVQYLLDHVVSAHRTVACIACHNPHRKLDVDAAWDACAACHPTKGEETVTVDHGNGAPCATCHTLHKKN